MNTTFDPLRILAIHGYRQSDTIFSAKLGALRKGFKKQINFTFVQAPHLVPSETCIEEQDDSLEQQNECYGWWFNTEDRVFKAIVPSNLSVGFEESIAVIEKEFANNGPFDGILGFSQGAAFVTILCAMQQKKLTGIKFNFAIIISGFKSLCAPHAVYYDEKIHIPSLHIYGESDKVIPREMGEEVSELFLNKTKITHEGGHYVPGKKDFYKAFITDMLANKNVDK